MASTDLPLLSPLMSTVMCQPNVLVCARLWIGEMGRATLVYMTRKVYSNIQGVCHLSFCCDLGVARLRSVNSTSSHVGTMEGQRGSYVRRPR